MKNKFITVSAWKGGSYTYGLRMSKSDRDMFVTRGLEYVFLELPGMNERVKIHITDSFWRKCSEFRSKDIRTWLELHDLKEWPHGEPHKFRMVKKSEDTFEVQFLDR